MLTKIGTFARRLAQIAAHDPKDLQHIFGMANYAAGEILDPEADVRPVEAVDVLTLTTQSARWKLQTFPGIGASISPLECAALASLCHSVNAKRVFEFGTYMGVSTTQLALNIPDDGQVFTLDLPEDHPAYSLPIPKMEEQQIASEKNKGILVPEDIRGKVSFLRSDSATFDETPYLESIDLVFVDGAHSYEYVKNDSEKGLRMLRKGGVVAWHDFVPNHRDVVRYVRNCGLNVKRVSGTALAFAYKR